jgi:hypothetical protein
VDLYFLHALDELGPLDDKELVKTVERLKKAGTIRFFGFSCHDGNVAELLRAAARRASFVDAVMFRYSFRDYGNKELNEAIDLAHKAGVGLIAMKTQGSEAGIEKAWKKFEQTGRWNKFQAVLKAVWADERIAATVSHMETLQQLRENIEAAVDGKKLGSVEQEALDRYAAGTRSYACGGCDHICGAATGTPISIATALRALTYYDTYGDHEKARRVFRRLPLSSLDFGAANRACPHGVDVASLMKHAAKVLA